MRDSLGRLAWLAGLVAWMLLVQPVAPPHLLADQRPSADQEQPQEKPPQPPPPQEAAEQARPASAEKRPPATPTSSGSAEPDQVFFEFKYAVNNTELAGNRERSFLNPGVNHIFDFSSYLNRSYGIRRLETLSVFRYTDDPRVDPERNSLQRAYVRLAGPTFEATLGDHLVSYTRFALNQNIKGLNVRKDLRVLEGLRLTGTAGTFSDRWGGLFRNFAVFADPRLPADPRFPAKPYTRLVLGLRAEQKLNRLLTVGASYSQGSDVIRSLPRESQIPPLNNQLAGVDATLSLGRDFRLAGEAVYSWTQFDARFQHEKRGDYAVRAEASHRLGRFSWRAEYALFRPNFFSANARQVQDLQDFSVRGGIDLHRMVVLQASYRRTNDNLSGTPALGFVPDPLTGALQPTPLTHPTRTLTMPGVLLVFDHVVDAAGNPMTTVARLPELRAVLRRLPRLKSLQVDVGYRERHLETSNRGSFDPVSGVPLFRERLTKMPFADFNLPTRFGLFTLGYEYRHNRDTVRRDNSTFTHRFTGSYSGSWSVRRWSIVPRLRYETERISKQLGLDPVDDPLTRQRLLDPLTGLPLIDTFSGGDQTRSLQASLEVELPSYFSFRFFYRELSAKLLTGFPGLDFFPVPSGGFSQTVFGNGGYRRPAFRGQLTYRIRNEDNRFLTVTVDRNVNSFAVPNPLESDSRSFRETVAQVSVVWRFRRP